MQKSKSYIIISLLLIASMLMSAMAPMLQEPASTTPAADVTENLGINQDELNQNSENEVINTQVGQQNLSTEGDTKTVMPTSENEGNSGATDPVNNNVDNIEENNTVNNKPEGQSVENTGDNIADNQNTNGTNGSSSEQNENQNENKQENPVEGTNGTEGNTNPEVTNGTDGNTNPEGSNGTEGNNGPENGVLEGQERQEGQDNPQGQSGEQQEQQAGSENDDAEALSSAILVSVTAVEGKPEFLVKITNNGEVNLSEVAVESSATVAYNSTGTVRSASGKFLSVNGEAIEEGKASYKIASLDAGQSVDLTYSVGLPSGFSMANINGVITVNALYLDGETTKTVAASSSGTSVVTGTELQFANLTVTLADEKEGFYFPGEAILHQVVVSNEGEFDVSNVEVNYAGLSAENYEDIPCVFTSVCTNGECETIPQEKQDSIYTVDSIKAGEFASLYCENGVNDSYSENVTYHGSVNVNASVNDKEDGTVPADYNVTAQSNNVSVEVVVPLAQPAKMLMKGAPLRAPLLGATPKSFIFAVDCVETTCFTEDHFDNIPMYVSFHNTATEGNYCSVQMTADVLAGNFTKFGRGTNGANIRTIPLENIASPSGSYTFTDIAPGDVVVAVFEADPSQSESFTPSKDYYFKFNASVNDCTDSQNTSAEATKASCDPQPGFYGTASAPCVEPGGTTAVHTITIVNNGDVDLCQVLGTTRASGSFVESGNNRLIYNETIAKGASKTFTFNQSVNSSTSSDVVFNFAGAGCDTTTEVSATVNSKFEYCSDINPEIGLGITPPAKCHEKGAGEDTIELELKNTGTTNLCKAELHVQYKYNNNVVHEEDITVPAAFLTAGATEKVTAKFNPETYSIPDGKTYDVVATLKGFVDANGDGTCDATPALTIEATTEVEICELTPDMDISVEPVPDCHEPESGDSDEFTVHVNNTGDKDLCKAVLVAEYKYNNQVVYTEEKAVPANLLAAGATGDVIFNFNPDDYDIPGSSSYTFHVTLKGYDGEGTECDSTPVITKEGETDMETCEEKTPDMSVNIEVPSECHEPGSGNDTFVVIIKNTGTKNLCSAEIKYEFTYNGQAFYSQRVTLPEFILEAGKSGRTTYSINPDNYNIPAGASYNINVTLTAYDGKDGTCDAEPIVTSSAQGEKDICENPGMTFNIVEKPECHPVGGGEEEFVVNIKNSGDSDMCSAVVKGWFEYNGQTVQTETKEVPADLLIAGNEGQLSFYFTPEQHGIKQGESYTFHAQLLGYTDVDKDGTCDTDPVVDMEKTTDMDICPEEPGMTIDIEEKPECHPTGSGQEEFVVDVKNTGDSDMCSAVVEGQFEYNGFIVRTETKEVPADLLIAGSEGKLSFFFDPDEYGIGEGESYTFQAHLIAYADEDGDGTCDTEPAVDMEKTTDMSICTREPHKLTAINMNNSCYDGDEVQFFKGIIDIPEGAEIQSIDVTTNQVKVGSQKYDCVITKVMNVGDDMKDFVDIDKDEQDISYHFENLVPGKNTAGFICEAKLDSNQVSNGRKITFSATSMANYPDKEIEVESNEVVDTQNCVRVRTINLPATGDDTNMPLLIGGFTLLVILAGGSTFAIKKRKDNSTAK